MPEELELQSQGGERILLVAPSDWDGTISTISQTDSYAERMEWLREKAHAMINNSPLSETLGQDDYLAVQELMVEFGMSFGLRGSDEFMQTDDTVKGR